MEFVTRLSSVCVECQHFQNLDPGSVRANVWYNHVCRQHPLPEGVDPVTGKEGYVQQNDLGRTFVADQQYAFCREHNDGSCGDFEPKQGDHNDA